MLSGFEILPCLLWVSLNNSVFASYLERNRAADILALDPRPADLLG